MKMRLFLLLGFFNVLLLFGQYENTLIPYRLKDRWGYCDVKGKIKIKPEFEFVGLYNEGGYAIVKQKGKYGIIDAKGKFTCTPKFKYLTYVNPNNYYEYSHFVAINFKNEEYNVDYKGLKISIVRTYNRDDNVKIPDFEDEGNIQKFFRKSKIDNLHAPNLTQIYESHFYFKMNNDTFIYCIDKLDKHGILNNTFQEIVPTKFAKIEEYQGLFKVSLNNSSYKDGLYSNDGKQLLEPIYSIRLESRTKFLISNQMKVGIFDIKKRKITIPVKYKHVFCLNSNNKYSYIVTDSIALIHDNYCFMNCKLIDENNQDIIDTIFKEVVLRRNEDTSLFLARTTNGWNCYSLSGEKEFKVDYNSIYLLDDYYYINPCALVSKTNNLNEIKYGIITLSDSILTPLIYDKLDDEFDVFDMNYSFSYSRKLHYGRKILASKNNKFGIITIQNEIIVPIIYKNITVFLHSPFAFVELSNGKAGYINCDNGLEYFKE